MNRTVRMLGTRGVPANYGGFETAAENVAKFLVERGWRVVVYCQVDGTGPITTDEWQGIERVLVPVATEGALGTVLFDWKSIRHASKYRDLCLTFGYNTGFFNIMQRLRGIPNVINMDGIEWSRARWSPFKRATLYVNERFAAAFGNTLIADHPEIEKYLWTRAPQRKITTVAYGAHPVVDPDESLLAPHGVEAGKYFTLIARPVPENSIRELVKGFSAKRRGAKLLVLGDFDRDKEPYHGEVLDAAGDEVVFAGAVFDPATVQALRFFSRGYLHGHTVGGTNPSLVEALAAGNPVIAHDNAYNRWVAGDAALYFADEKDVSSHIETVLDSPGAAKAMSEAALARHRSEFTWDRVAGQYEEILDGYVRKTR